MLPFPGLMASEAIFAALTFNDTLLFTAPELAEITVFPKFVAVARPLFVIEATVGAEELQFTLAVMSCVVPSVNDPVAVNGCSTPSGIDRLLGEIAMVVSAAFVTVRLALPEIFPELAVIVELPGVSPFAVPSVGIVSLTFATVAEDELQLAVDVTS